uniref:Protein kinase domain-containing protein n=1 Tax=Solanum lycopersicum TaxID=4081 RepID=K4AT55_SOLLC
MVKIQRMFVVWMSAAKLTILDSSKHHVVRTFPMSCLEYNTPFCQSSHVAVKILSNPKADGKDFIDEVATIGRIHHVNIVQLIGYCVERCKRILHFDIKPHNILLDENFIPKLSDFSQGPISYKADVYSFGMLLVDIVGLKTNSVAREDMSNKYFTHWIYDQLDKGKEIEVLDETHEDVKKLTLVAVWCIQMNPLDRPSMTRVVEMLEGELQALKKPPRPSESREPCSLDFNLTSSSLSLTDSMKLLESCSVSTKVDVIVA